MKILITSLLIYNILACSITFSLSAQSTLVNNTSREAAHIASLEKALSTSANFASTNGLTTYTPGFDAALFESNLETNACIEISTVYVNVVDEVNQVGTFTNGIADAGLGIDAGIILTTGTIDEAFTDNNAVLVSQGSSDANAIDDPDLDVLDPGGQTTHNESILIIDFTVPPGLTGIKVPFQFSSDEYPEYVGTKFNDVFGFFISGPGITGTKNIALVPGKNQVIAVNSINGGEIVSTSNAQNYPAGGSVHLDNSEYFIDNTDGTNAGPIISEYDGFSTVLYATAENLIEGETYRLKLAIADVADHYGDSGVFIGPIVGSYTGSTFVECSCDLTDPLIDCDEDGVLNGSDCNPADPTIVAEGDVCTDLNLDTGFIDANCICIATTGSTSGGNDGGLESNNRLADKIAKRNYNRTVNPNETDILKSIGAIPFKPTTTTNSKNNGLNLSEIIPTNIWGAYVAESSPTDLLDITNAVEVVAADYYLNDVRNAAVLAIKSENGVYEHSKYICDRLDGASLLDVYFTYVDGKSFITYEIETKEGLKEYACSFSGFIKNNKLEIENYWSLDKYLFNDQYYNFQIWSSSIGKTKSLLISILNNLEQQIEIGNHTTGTIPGSFIKNGYYENGKLLLNIVNKTKTEVLVFNGEYRLTENASLENFTSEVTTSKGLNEELILETGYLYDMGMSMVIDADHSDELFIADGAWGFDDLNVNSIVNDFTVSPQESYFDDDAFGIERGISINAMVKDYQNVFRSITPKWNTIDLSAYNNLSFAAKGNGLVRITIVNPNETVWDKQVSHDFTLNENIEGYTIPLTDFTNYTTTSNLANVNMIVISIIGDNINFSEKEITIKDINFNNNQTTEVITNDYELQYTEFKMYPNPTDGLLNINLNTAFEVENVMIYNTTGAMVYKTNFKNKKATVRLDLSSLNSGLYLINIRHNKGEEMTRTILKN